MLWGTYSWMDSVHICSVAVNSCQSPSVSVYNTAPQRGKIYIITHLTTHNALWFNSVIKKTLLTSYASYSEYSTCHLYGASVSGTILAASFAWWFNPVIKRFNNDFCKRCSHKSGTMFKQLSYSHYTSPILNYQHWEWSWSRFLGSQPAVINPVVGCR